MSPLTQIGPMNIGNPTEFTIKQLAEMTVRLTKSSSKIIYKPLPQVILCGFLFHFFCRTAELCQCWVSFPHEAGLAGFFFDLNGAGNPSENYNTRRPNELTLKVKSLAPFLLSDTLFVVPGEEISTGSGDLKIGVHSVGV